MIISNSATANLKTLIVKNKVIKSIITIRFNQSPVYNCFFIDNPERIVLDISQSIPISLKKKIILKFNRYNLIKSIRTSTQKNNTSIRIVFDIQCSLYTNVTIQQVSLRKFGKNYNLVIIIRGQTHTNTTNININKKNNVFISSATTTAATLNKLLHSTSLHKLCQAAAVSTLPITIPIVVAIDAGHGGQDPGATGNKGLKEKNVTIAIARKLKIMLNADPMFKPVLTRNRDYFMSVIDRSEVARKHGASVLVSIHTDAAASNRRACGASVWILSNRRAHSEIYNWLEQYDKQYKLIGCASKLLTNSIGDPYFSKLVLDLQFDHSQRVGYEIAVKVLGKLKIVGSLHKTKPQYANLGVLRSPDIPSLLVETGFISNIREELLLGSSSYQKKIANALHLGLRAYFIAHTT
ncbi:N-acetylmuramoyl-L-alanine amidase [Candidatus Palibaumannia cicadellinicola]|uniref:N-acetylmuramoyl-L-alanine amidase n=1 Tax=Candidatus Palibaumannia cicadellinicola TaxID=186490 RepID=A0A0K2BLB4_9GAMM|nr:N-acetylmuramoyl-L-alanine amidase [Candidatus Baumannia cicadellinicola]AKZ66110.1 N-acetylmuramoyl-L-alanine amidase [Candidatus Baumannia cicadellinicola]